MLVGFATAVECAQAQILLQPGFDQTTIATIAGRTRAWGVGVADFNNDGFVDIVSGDTSGDAHLYTGNGTGAYSDAGIVINMTFNDAYGLAVGDFNGDGNQDFVLTRTAGTAEDGQILLYLGNGNGTFQSVGTLPQLGLLVGDAGTDVVSVAAADVDGDGDVDLVAGDITASANSAADVTLFRNLGNDGSGHPTWSAAIIISALNVTVDPEVAPYYPPTTTLSGYGLAFGDMDGDGDQDLLVSDRASYLYVYRNDGTGTFALIRYERVSSRPLAFARLHETFTTQAAIATGDMNGDGRVDFVTGNCDGTWEGMVDLWLNTGNDGSGRPEFMNAGIIGGAGTDARGIATGQLNSAVDSYRDIVFGNFEASLYGLWGDQTDTDTDGIVDRFDNAPQHPNAPRLDMNTDGGINRLDQLDNDHDGIGDPADPDDDNDGVADAADNCPFNANSDQADADTDGRGDACDPLNNLDSDGDGIFDGPLDPAMRLRATQAKAAWSLSDTHFIVRIDALGRAFQNEFTQILTDAAIWSPAEWATKKLENYNGIGDDPATAGYQVPADLDGGKEVPVTVAVIPKILWDAFGDPDPIGWINDRIVNPKFEIAQHGTYHVSNTMLGDWAGMPDRNFYSCETCGFSAAEMFQYLRVGRRTLLGEYGLDPWIQQSGAVPGVSPAINWLVAANPLIAYAPPFNASDTPSRDATGRFGYAGFSASIYEESSLIFAPEGSRHEMFDEYGMYHASADRQVDPVVPNGMTYDQYLASITQVGALNTWLIEEVEWSTRYCNTTPRLDPCAAAPGGINRENNMVDPTRWALWLTLLDYVKAAGQPMTLGDYSLAVASDNAPTVPNADQADADHDGIGDVIDGAALAAFDADLAVGAAGATGNLTARLTNGGFGIDNQLITFRFDADGDGTPEVFTANTNAAGDAAAVVVSTRPVGDQTTFTAEWNGVVATANATANVRIVPSIGDMDCNGTVASTDIEPFVLALADPAGYQAAYPACNINHADIDGNNSADGADIQPFIQLLLSH